MVIIIQRFNKNSSTKLINNLTNEERMFFIKNLDESEIRPSGYISF